MVIEKAYAHQDVFFFFLNQIQECLKVWFWNEKNIRNKAANSDVCLKTKSVISELLAFFEEIIPPGSEMSRK